MFHKLKTGLKYAGLALLAVHAMSQVRYSAHDISSQLDPSPLREEFEEEFGFPLLGWEEAIEGEANPRTISHWAEIIHREKAQKSFDLGHLQIGSRAYFQKPFSEQLEGLVTNGFRGRYFHEDNSVTLMHRPSFFSESDRYNKTLIHEIKHAKTFAVLKEHPELLSRWKKLSVDEGGDSLYLHPVERFFKRLKGFDNFIDKKKLNSETNEILGFVSNYARTNVYEDIAELCEFAEVSPSVFSKWLNGVDDHNIIRQKVELAQEYGLISPEFFDYVLVSDLFLESKGNNGEISNLGVATQFMQKSEKLLADNPHSIYQAELHNLRGYVMEQVSWVSSNDEYAEKFPLLASFSKEDIIQEYKEVLTVGFKSPDHYGVALMELSGLVDDPRAKERYLLADEESLNQYKTGVLTLARLGVNHLLQEKDL